MQSASNRPPVHSGRTRDLPRPDVTAADAARILQDRFGLLRAGAGAAAGADAAPRSRGRSHDLAAVPARGLDLHELGSQQDRNFSLALPPHPDGAGASAADSRPGRLLLKVANPAFGRDELEAQLAAMRQLHAAGVPAQQPLAGDDGHVLQEVVVGGTRLLAYLLTYLDGRPLADHGHLAPVVVARMGALAGEVTRALAAFDHPGTLRHLQWDLRHGSAVVADLGHHILDTQLQGEVVAVADAARTRLAPLEPSLREQAIHGDLTDDNVVCATGQDGRPWPAGVIDLGDLHRGWLVAELAVTCASLLQHDIERPLGVLPAVRAFAGVSPLEPAEVAALWPLVALRAAVLAASSAQQVAIDPGNDYVTAQQERERRLLAAVAAVPFDLAEEAVRDCLGMPPASRGVRWPPSPESVHPMVPALAGWAPDALPVLDLSVTSDALHEGRFLEPGIEDRLAAQSVERAGTAVLRWGEYRLTRSGVDRRTAPATYALGVELHLPAGTPVRAPVAGSLTRTAEGLTLTADGAAVIVTGLLVQREEEAAPATPTSAEQGRAVAAGELLGTALAGSAVGVQVRLVPDLTAPWLCVPEDAAAWARLCPDPSPLLGVACAAPQPEPAALLDRRLGAFAGVQEHYYAAPPQIERGWQHHLADTTARTYVDMVNNVTSIGHGHPRLVRDLARQWSLLNTNSRFHYRLLAELTGRLADLAPDGLDTVLLVNSGSEAVDLALRMAQVHTGRRAVLAVQEAYHGWTLGADAVTSSVADNPNALTTRPDWVHLLAAPNAFRGVHRGPGAGAAYVRDVEEVLAGMAVRGVEPAAYIAEPFYGNAGGVALPPGYLQGVYAAVRASGGLCIADEVQVGYGRLGRWFWGVQQQGVVPDLITVAKAMGNGHPVGAVITRAEIAETFAAEGSFFSSAGGSPVSCQAALTVLNVLRDEDLQGNAERVGGHLRDRLRELASRHPLIGAVHGEGLYLGVELVRDRSTLEPAEQETAAICDRLLELGVVLQPTGDRRNVLKVKPPLCLTRESADFVADRLDEVLTDGW